jgi:hypothetical protein
VGGRVVLGRWAAGAGPLLVGTAETRKEGLTDVLAPCCARLFGFSVRLDEKTEAEADDRAFQMLKPKLKPKTKKNEISARFG